MTNRRSFLAALGAGYAIANNTWAQSQRATSTTRNSELFFTADTQYGKIQGMANTGVKEFKGVPYGASTAGRNRYMPPQKPAPWTGSAGQNRVSHGMPKTVSASWPTTVSMAPGEGMVGAASTVPHGVELWNFKTSGLQAL